MSPRRSRAAAVVTVLAAAARLLATPAPQPAAAAPPGHAVVVELFTSQGCATCPPADRLLAALGKQFAGKVVPLAFHVDSWNHAGWTDPFSDAAWTRRHASYARVLRTGAAYTPQAIVDGSVAMVGSDEAALRAAIVAAAGRPTGQIDLDLLRGTASVLAHVAVKLPPELDGRALDLLLAVYETGLETPVGRGENGGRRLQDDYVVRSLTRVGRLAPRAGSGESSRFDKELRLGKGWNLPRLGVAAFLQDPRTLAIHGAGARWLDPGRDP